MRKVVSFLWLSLSEENGLSSADVRNHYVVLCFEPGAIVLISIKPFKVMWTKTFLEKEISCNCIAFHPRHDVILPGRLDQVLSLTDGSWQPGSFVCEKNYFFTDCCFSPDNKIMITGNDRDEHLILWDLVSGENKRRIKVGEHVWSCSFSSNGNYLTVLRHGSIRHCAIKDMSIDWSLFDVVNDYNLLFRSRIYSFEDLEEKPASLTASKSDKWFFSNSTKLSEFCYNGERIVKESRDLQVAWEQLFFLPSTKSYELVDRSVTSQIMPNFHYFRKLLFVSEPIPWYLINLHDELNLAISDDYELTLEVNKLTSGNISFDGRYFYQHSQSSRQLRVLKRDGKGWIFLDEKIFRDVIAFAVVINGVFIVTTENIIEIWNIEMTQRLMHCQKMAAIECCENVSDYIIACVGKTEVSFINSCNLQVVSTTLVSENQLVLACSSKYDVLVKDSRFQNRDCFIMRNNKGILSRRHTDNFQAARFSPNVNKFVLLSGEKFDCGYHCYGISGVSVTKVSGRRKKIHEMVCFLDNEYFITFAAERNLCLNSIHSDIPKAKIRLDHHATSVFYCHATQALIVNYRNNNFQEFRVIWPKT